MQSKWKLRKYTSSRFFFRCLKCLNLQLGSFGCFNFTVLKKLQIKNFSRFSAKLTKVVLLLSRSQFCKALLYFLEIQSFVVFNLLAFLIKIWRNNHAQQISFSFTLFTNLLASEIYNFSSIVQKYFENYKSNM